MPTPTYDFTQDYPVRNAAGEIITAKPFPNYTATAAPVKIASPQMPSVVVVGVPFRIVPGSYRDATAISAPTLVNLTRQPDGLYVANAPGAVSYSETPSNGVGAMPAQTTSGTAVANLSRLEIKTPASVSPATVAVGESVTLSVGVVQGEVRREVSLVHNGVERRNEITGDVWRPGVAGSGYFSVKSFDKDGDSTEQRIAYDVASATATVPVGPKVTTQPTISGGTAIGDILTLARGAATGNPAPTATYQWYRNGTALPGEDALTLDTGGHGAGVYRATVIWANGVTPAATGTTGTITVEAANAAGIDYSRALVYFDANTPFTGTASDVTAITSRGSAGLSLAKTGTAAIQRTANGFVFADTGYVGASGIAAGAVTDGMFLVVEFTQNAVGSNWARLSDGTGSRMRLQIHSGNQSIIGTGADDTNVNITLGTATLGTRHIVAFEMDDVLNQMTGYGASGASVGPIAHAGLTDPVNTRIDIGQFLNGTIHRWCLVGRTEGGAWPLTMAEVFADFRAGA